MKVSFPFSMTVINRFLSQVYRSFIMVTVVVKGSQDKSHDRLRLGLNVGCQ